MTSAYAPIGPWVVVECTVVAPPQTTSLRMATPSFAPISPSGRGAARRANLHAEALDSEVERPVFESVSLVVAGGLVGPGASVAGRERSGLAGTEAGVSGFAGSALGAFVGSTSGGSALGGSALGGSALGGEESGGGGLAFLSATI